MSDTQPQDQDSTTDLDELNEHGVGGTVGEKDGFEPEETEHPDTDKA